MLWKVLLMLMNDLRLMILETRSLIDNPLLCLLTNLSFFSFNYWFLTDMIYLFNLLALMMKIRTMNLAMMLMVQWLWMVTTAFWFVVHEWFFIISIYLWFIIDSTFGGLFIRFLRFSFLYCWWIQTETVIIAVFSAHLFLYDLLFLFFQFLRNLRHLCTYRLWL